MRPPFFIAAVASLLTAACCLAVVWFVPAPVSLPRDEPPPADREAVPAVTVSEDRLGQVLALPAAPARTAAPLRPLESILLGTLASRDPQHSRAAVLVGGHVRTVAIGDALEDGAVAEIRRGHVVIERSGRRSEVPTVPGAGGTPPRVETAAGRLPLAITATGTTTFRLQRDDLVAGLADPSADWMRARVLPVAEGGRIRGFKVAVPAASTLEQLGLRTGDVLVSANGTALDSVGAAMALLPRLHAERRVELDVLRAGNPVRLTYWID